MRLAKVGESFPELQSAILAEVFARGEEKAAPDVVEPLTAERLAQLLAIPGGEEGPHSFDASDAVPRTGPGGEDAERQNNWALSVLNDGTSDLLLHWIIGHEIGHYSLGHDYGASFIAFARVRKSAAILSRPPCEVPRSKIALA